MIKVNLRAIALIFVFIIFSLLAFTYGDYVIGKSNEIELPSVVSTPTPTPSPIVLKEALSKDSYTIIMVGDSMTAALGPNADELRKALKLYYPDKVFGIYNLAKGSTNILSLQDVIKKEIPPEREFEVILIESFGYNPLSDLPLEEGLKKQTEALHKAVETIRVEKMRANVNSIIVFVATIAPNKDQYGKNAVDLTPEKREEWANERSAYIKNHMEYARSHNIPLINIYDKSLDREKITGDLQYIERGTFIHPSKAGVELISKEIADFLYNEKILPQ